MIYTVYDSILHLLLFTYCLLFLLSVSHSLRLILCLLLFVSCFPLSASYALFPLFSILYSLPSALYFLLSTLPSPGPPESSLLHRAWRT